MTRDYNDQIMFKVEPMGMREGKNYAFVNQFQYRFIQYGITYEEFVRLVQKQKVYKLIKNDEVAAIVARRENGTCEIIRVAVWYNESFESLDNLNAIQYIQNFMKSYV